MPEDISTIETNNLDDAEKKRKILDWTELYNSVLTNIQVASQKLSEIFAQIENQQNNLDSLNQNLLKVSGELSETETQKKLVLNGIQREREVFEETKSVFVSQQEKINLELKEKEKNLERKGFEIDDRIRIAKDKLVELKKQIEDKKAELSSLEKALVKVKGEMDSLKGEMDSLKENIVGIKQYQGNVLKENVSLTKQKEKIEAEIYKKQRSLDSFKGNKLKMEQDLLRKTKDLQILEGRLRKQFEKIGQDFKL